MDSDYEEIPVRLPSGSKAVMRLPRVFTLEDGVHLMNFMSAYITDKTGDPLPADGAASHDTKGEKNV